MEKINIAEILRNCPQGMELYSPLCGKCVFDRLNMGTIICKKQNTQEIIFTSEGYYMLPVFNDCECILFPSKDQRDWSKFQRPFKDGDIISDSLGTCIFKGEGVIQGTVDYYCGISCDHFSIQQNGHYGYITDYRFATEEEKAKLFDAIKANGYEWNEGTKTLVPKFKDGDVVAADDGVSCQLFLLKYVEYSKDYNGYDGYCYFGWDFYHNNLFEEGNWGFNRLATEKEKTKLFNTIKANGYEWDEETRTLVKLIKPKFKVGDKIIKKNSIYAPMLITQIGDEFYYSNTESSVGILPISKQDEYELIPNKFDINSLIPFESRVLLRDYNDDKWHPGIWGFYDKDAENYPYRLIGDIASYCIPYEGNEHLLGTTNDCDNFYKTWEK